MTQSDMHIAVYTGSFDPITLGHMNVIERCSRLVGRLVIGIGVNIDKQSLFSVDERIALVREATAELNNIEIHSFDGLAVDFVSDCRSRVMVRGVRSLSDIETVFLMAGEEYSHISSSLIKQIASLAGDDELRRFVPDMVATALRERLREQDES
jgi:pantetheine-phosphate adenylyltransferase